MLTLRHTGGLLNGAAVSRDYRTSRPKKVPPKFMRRDVDAVLTRAGADVAATGTSRHQAGIDDADDAQRRDEIAQRSCPSSSPPQLLCTRASVRGLAAKCHLHRRRVNSSRPTRELVDLAEQAGRRRLAPIRFTAVPTSHYASSPRSAHLARVFVAKPSVNQP
jgi:hypothetical protein